MPIFVLRNGVKILFCCYLRYFLPPSQSGGWIPRPHPIITFSPHVKSAESGRGGVGGGLGSPLGPFPKHRN
jgi:hypothetical protein